MEIPAFFISLKLALSLFEGNSFVALGGSLNNLKTTAGLRETRNADRVGSEPLSMKCMLLGSARLPAFSVDGDYIIGGVFSIHNNMLAVINNYTVAPKPQRCTGRLVRTAGDYVKLLKSLDFNVLRVCFLLCILKIILCSFSFFKIVIFFIVQ